MRDGSYIRGRDWPKMRVDGPKGEEILIIKERRDKS
jgi:hypothetical protein